MIPIPWNSEDYEEMRKILEEGKKALETRGWIKGKAVDYKTGEVCGLGALRSAHIRCKFSLKTHVYSIADTKALEMMSDDQVVEQQRIGLRPTAYYNDYVAQDVGDMIVLFEKAIADLP